jgi:predicted RNA binding protein with dsRBD fold (UPF0201 family)
MSEQSLNLTEDWKKVREAFKNDFKSENVEIRDEMMRYSRSGEGLKIRKNGEISGSMPIHQSKLTQVEEIVFRDSEIEFKSDVGSYAFRR